VGARIIHGAHAREDWGHRPRFHQLAHKRTPLLPSSSLLAICSLGSQVKEPLFSSPCLQLQSCVC
jgi:hypothetical protein